MIGIMNPPVETGHNWRQVTGLMVARNFLEVDDSILYPRIDDNRGESGIIGMEFPLLNYLHFLLAKLFGYAHWYGRLINLIFSSLGVFFFYKILKENFDKKTALASSLCLLSSVWFMFSRKMMPDTFCISLMFIALYFGMQFMKNGRLWSILSFVLFSSLAILTKIPAGIYLVVLIPIAIFNSYPKRRIAILFATMIPVVACYLWYFQWNYYLAENFGNWYNAGRSLQEGFMELYGNLGLVAKRFYFSAFQGFLFFSLFIAGLFLMIKNGNKRLIVGFVSVAFVFVVYVLKSGFFFYHHNYYIIPFVPMMALLVGYSLSKINKQWVFVCILGLGMIEGVSNQQHDLKLKQKELYKLNLEELSDEFIGKDKLICINGENNPQQIYLSHRKGWTCTNEQLLDEGFMDDIIEKGCEFLIVNKNSFNQSLSWPIIFDDDDFIIYKLGEGKL